MPAQRGEGSIVGKYIIARAPYASYGHNVYHRSTGRTELRIQPFCIGVYPSATLPIRLSAMFFTIYRIAAMVGGDYDEPFFFVLFLAVLYSLPYIPDPSICANNSVRKLGTVAIPVSHIVGKLKIYPGKIGCFFFNRLCSFS